MKLRFTIAGLCVFALIALPLRAQHGGGGHSGGGHFSGSHVGGGWHAGSTGSGGGHYSGGGESRTSASGSYAGAAMYPPSARGHDSAGSEESARPAESYYSNHDPASQSGWQSLYTGGSNIHFAASMLPPNARGYSAAPHESANTTAATRAGVTPLRLQSQWTVRQGFDGRDRFHHRFRAGFGRGFGEPFCGPFVSFNFEFCGGSLFYGFYGAGFGCIGGSYRDDSNWEAEPAVLNLSPCFVSSSASDEDQVSSDDSPYEFESAPAPDASAADANSPSDVGASGVGPTPAAADQRPETLLQLKDGSMYGLVQYWVAGGLLNYITDYGARNAIPFERIDFAKTVQLNSQRGVAFILQTNSDSH